MLDGRELESRRRSTGDVAVTLDDLELQHRRGHLRPRARPDHLARARSTITGTALDVHGDGMEVRGRRRSSVRLLDDVHTVLRLDARGS